MKVDITKKDLLGLISKTQNIVEKKNALPILLNILIECQNDRIKVYATDLEVSLTDSVECKVHSTGKVVVSAKSLFEIIKELEEGQISLFKRENNWLEIKQGKYNSKIVGLNSEEYPIFPTCEIDSFIDIDASLFKEMIDKTIYSISNDETRYHLNGVYFEINPQIGLRMVATDGHRLSLINKNIKILNVDVTRGVIIPRKGLNEIRKITEGNNGVIKIAIEGSQLILKNSETTLMIRLIEGNYPNYQQYIPQTFSQKAIVNRELLLTSLKRVSLLANQKSKAVLINLSKGKMEVTSNNPELGDATEEIEVSYEGEDLKIGFNAKYITDILNNISNDTIEIDLNTQITPGLVRPYQDQSYTCVIMPMRI